MQNKNACQEGRRETAPILLFLIVGNFWAVWNFMQFPNCIKLPSANIWESLNLEVQRYVDTHLFLYINTNVRKEIQPTLLSEVSIEKRKPSEVWHRHLKTTPPLGHTYRSDHQVYLSDWYNRCGRQHRSK